MHRQLAPAKLTQRRHHPLGPSVGGLGLLTQPRHNARDTDVSQPRELLLQRRQVAVVQPLDEHLDLFDMPQPTDPVGSRCGVARPDLVQFSLPGAPVGLDVRPHGHQHVEHLGILGQAVGEQVAGVEQRDQLGAQRRAVEQRAIQRAGRARAGHDALQPVEHARRLRRCGDLSQHHCQEVGQQVPCRRPGLGQRRNLV